MKLPAMQFYPGDWKKDLGVQSLTLEERGFWFELLLLMFESEERGKLILNGRAMTEFQIANAVNLDKQKATTMLTTLLTSGVASRDPETGALMCRRMVREENLRKIRSESGKLGGNPALVKQNETKSGITVKQNPTPSSSSSSSSSEKKNPPTPFSDRTAKEPDPSDLVTQLIDAHPKHRPVKRTLAETQIADITAGHFEQIVRLKANHEAWCEYWAKQTPKYTPALTTWLGDGSWRDPPPAEDEDEVDRMAREIDEERARKEAKT